MPLCQRTQTNVCVRFTMGPMGPVFVLHSQLSNISQASTVPKHDGNANQLARVPQAEARCNLLVDLWIEIEGGDAGSCCGSYTRNAKEALSRLLTDCHDAWASNNLQFAIAYDACENHCCYERQDVHIQTFEYDSSRLDGHLNQFADGEGVCKCESSAYLMHL